jgi:hypothetical protein
MFRVADYSGQNETVVHVSSFALSRLCKCPFAKFVVLRCCGVAVLYTCVVLRSFTVLLSGIATGSVERHTPGSRPSSSTSAAASACYRCTSYTIIAHNTFHHHPYLSCESDVTTVSRRVAHQLRRSAYYSP